MTEPWFDEMWFGIIYGAGVGGGGGSLAGVLGGLAGWLAPKGKGRPWIVGGMYAFLVFGVLSLGFGLVALLAGQPYGIWFPPTLVGVIFTVAVGCNIPTVHRLYRVAEQRRLEAEGLRSS